MFGKEGSRTPARLRLAALLLAAPLAVVTTGTIAQAAPVPAVAMAQTAAAPADTTPASAVDRGRGRDRGGDRGGDRRGGGGDRGGDRGGRGGRDRCGLLAALLLGC
jgi:uncharacterized membrane protein YgcG